MPQLVDHLVEARSRDELHHIVVQAAALADAEDRHDIGMVQPGRGLGLALEPLEVVGVEQGMRAAGP